MRTGYGSIGDHVRVETADKLSDMYVLGQIARVVYAANERGVPPNVLAMLLSRPSVGLGMMLQSPEARTALDERRDAYDGRLRSLVDRLPASLPDSVRLEEQGPFWLGWYHTPPWPIKRDIDGLREAGEALFGPQWQTALAGALGLSDARRVRQWLSGERRIPDGIWGDIKRLLNERANKAVAVSEGLDTAPASADAKR